jgi:hypothetical protein
VDSVAVEGCRFRLSGEEVSKFTLTSPSTTKAVVGCRGDALFSSPGEAVVDAVAGNATVSCGRDAHSLTGEGVINLAAGDAGEVVAKVSSLSMPESEVGCAGDALFSSPGGGVVDSMACAVVGCGRNTLFSFPGEAVSDSMAGDEVGCEGDALFSSPGGGIGDSMACDAVLACRGNTLSSSPGEAVSDSVAGDEVGCGGDAFSSSPGRMINLAAGEAGEEVSKFTLSSPSMAESVVGCREETLSSPGEAVVDSVTGDEVAGCRGDALSSSPGGVVNSMVGDAVVGCGGDALFSPGERVVNSVAGGGGEEVA